MFYRLKSTNWRCPIKEYRSVIAARHPALEAVLRSGLPRDAVKQRFATLPFAITEDAIDLYSWADGAEDGRVNMIPISYFYAAQRRNPKV